MPKRSHAEDDSDHILRKIRKYEKKLQKRKRARARSSSRSSSSSQRSIPDDTLSDFDLCSMMAEKVESEKCSISNQEAVIEPIESLPTIDKPSESGPELDEEILNLLGETPSKEQKFNPPIQNELAVRWEHISSKGLSSEIRKELLKDHLPPSNCTKIAAPKLNPEIKAALSDTLLKRDKMLEYKQGQIAATISCVGEALTRVFTLEHKDQTVVKLLIEAGRLLCDTQYKESLTRRRFICSTLKKGFKEQLNNTDIDSYLFGETLSETLKAAKAIYKSGAELKNNPLHKKTTAQTHKPPTQSLNQKPPPSAARQQGAAQRSEQEFMLRPRQRQQPPQRLPQRSQQRPAARR